MNKDLEKLLESLDERAMRDELGQYEEGVRDMLIALQGGKDEIKEFATELMDA